LFVGNYEGKEPWEYWLISPDGKPARRLGSFRAHDVHPSPDGRHIVYIAGRDVFVSTRDGTDGEKIATFPSKWPFCAIWAPDGRRVRLSATDKTGETSIWEVAADGSGVRPLLPGWRTPSAECCGRWTSDGRYYVFQATENQSTSLWAIREARWPWERSRSA